jgi:hypothetical protein
LDVKSKHHGNQKENSYRTYKYKQKYMRRKLKHKLQKAAKYKQDSNTGNEGQKKP